MTDIGFGKLGSSAVEPLVRLSDLAEYEEAYAHYKAGEWDDERWTGFRVRFGVYGQRQPGVQMVRIKIPGGIMTPDWLRAIAAVNREFATGDAHITTRQDIQLYSVPLERTPETLATLYKAGITTREACGNTLRNMTGCPLSGVCPREHVDAGAVAQQLARSWLRAPLVQHMPRKAKVSISGCSVDCGDSAIHDLAFIATEVDGQQGFAVYAGGGLGPTPRRSVKILDLVDETRLSAVVEAMARLHQRYSDRRNRNASRIKFVLKRFGEEKFRELFLEEYERVRSLPQRPWKRHQWRQPQDVAVARMPVGVVDQHDGSAAIMATPTLGLLSSEQLEQLADIAEAAGVQQLRTTREQNIVLLGIARDKAQSVAQSLRAIGIDVPEKSEDYASIMSCPGTTTCRIGITNSQMFAKQLVREAEGDANAKAVSVHVSGCHNSCGSHHTADFGLHGMAKKVDGRPAPHYLLHIGGSGRRDGDIALSGPLVPAPLANQVIKVLRDSYAAQKLPGETVRGWAERLGQDGLAVILKPITDKDNPGMYIDWGGGEFQGAPTVRGECAAPFANDDLFADLADDALIRVDRATFAGRWQQALAAAEEATVIAARRLLAHNGTMTADGEATMVVLETLRATSVGAPEIIDTLDAVLAERSAALSSGRIDGYREALALWIDTVRSAVVASPTLDDDLSAFAAL